MYHYYPEHSRHLGFLPNAAFLKLKLCMSSDTHDPSERVGVSH